MRAMPPFERAAGGSQQGSGNGQSLFLCIVRHADALEAAELPAFLQAGAHAAQLLSEGAGQPSQQGLHLRGADLEHKHPQQRVRSESESESESGFIGQGSLHKQGI